MGMSGKTSRNASNVAKQTASFRMDTGNVDALRSVIGDVEGIELLPGMKVSVAYTTEGRTAVKPVRPIMLMLDGAPAYEVSVDTFDKLLTALPELVTSDEELLLFDIEDGVEAAEGTAAVLRLAEAAGDGAEAMTALAESPIGPGAAALTDPSRLPRAKPRNGSATSGKAKSWRPSPQRVGEIII